MLKKLNQLSNIQTGIYEKSGFAGEVIYIQGRHINAERKIDPFIEPELQMSEKTRRHFLNEGDILFTSKGANLGAVVISQMSNPAVASSMFLVLRDIDKNVVLPEYVAWYLNHPRTQKFLLGSMKGTSLLSITKDDIGNLEIPVPSVQRQQKIIAFEALITKENQLIHKIARLRAVLNNYLLINATNE